jgi:hypothetical protein
MDMPSIDAENIERRIAALEAENLALRSKLVELESNGLRKRIPPPPEPQARIIHPTRVSNFVAPTREEATALRELLGEVYPQLLDTKNLAHWYRHVTEKGKP